MLKNPNPQTPIAIPDTDVYRTFEYVVLNPSSSQIGVVSIAALLYRNKEDLFGGFNSSDCYLGQIAFNINDPGLLTACEDFALTKFTGLQKCPVPTKSEENNE